MGFEGQSCEDAIGENRPPRRYIDSECVATSSGMSEQLNLIVQKELRNWRDYGKRSNIKVE